MTKLQEAKLIKLLTPLVKKALNESTNGFNVGDRVQISGGSGIDSGKKATIISPKEIKTDGRGVPTNVDGAYSPVDWKKEVAIKLDNGDIRTMYKSRLIKYNEPQTKIYR